MSILITGGAGYIGSHVAKLFTNAGLNVVVLDDLSTGQRRRVHGCKLVCADIADRSKVREVLRIHKVSCVVHLAAKAQVAESIRHPALYYSNNIVRSLALLDAMVEEGVSRFVFASSCSVYGNSATLATGEQDALAPISPYGVSKLVLEQALPGYERDYGLQWIALRFFNVAGAEESLHEDLSISGRIVPAAVRSALWRDRSLNVFGTNFSTKDGSAVRDYVHVADVARANLLALRYLEQGRCGAVLNIGSGRGTSVLEILDTVRRQTGSIVPCVVRPARAGDPPYAVSNISKAAEVLGWSPIASNIDTIVASVLHAAGVEHGISAVA